MYVQRLVLGAIFLTIIFVTLEETSLIRLTKFHLIGPFYITINNVMFSLLREMSGPQKMKLPMDASLPFRQLGASFFAVYDW